jgi:cytochrome c-type biogenesis protein CcmE
MTHRNIKITVTALVIIGSFTALMWSTLRTGTEYFKNVDEVLPNRQAWVGKTLQLHGYVVPGSILGKPNSLEWRFKVQNDPPHVATDAPADVVEAS